MNQGDTVIIWPEQPEKMEVEFLLLGNTQEEHFVGRKLSFRHISLRDLLDVWAEMLSSQLDIRASRWRYKFENYQCIDSI